MPLEADGARSQPELEHAEQHGNVELFDAPARALTSNGPDGDGGEALRPTPARS